MPITKTATAEKTTAEQAVKRGKRVRAAANKQQTDVADERKAQSDFLVGCTVDERAYCIRLIRLLRDDYWMTHFVMHILDKEARSKWQWTLKGVKKALENYDTLEALASNAQRIGNDWSNHPVLRAIRAQFGDEEMREYKSEHVVRELIESANK